MSWAEKKILNCGVTVCHLGQCSHIHTHIAYCCFAKKGKFPVENWAVSKGSKITGRADGDDFLSLPPYIS